MANVLAPFGFRRIRHVGQNQARYNEYAIASDYASQIHIGDPVKSVGTAGRIQLAARGDTILGIFMGCYVTTQTLGAANYGGAISGTVPNYKSFIPGMTVPSGLTIKALVDDDPYATWEAQCIGSVTTDDIGAFVNLEPRAGNALFGRSGYATSPVSPEGGALTSVTVGGSGSSYVQGAAITVTRHASDPYVGAESAAGTINVTTGNVTSVTLTAGGFYSASHLPTVTAPAGTGNTFLAVITNTTRDQFRIERILEKPMRQADSANNTTGYGLSTTGNYSLVELKCVNHERAGSAYGVAV